MGLGFLLVAGLLAVCSGLADRNGADGPALEAAVFFTGFFAAEAIFPGTAGFTRAAGAALFAAGFTAGARRPALLDLRFVALVGFLAAAFAAAGLARLRFAFAGFALTAFSEAAASDFCPAALLGFFAAFRAAFSARFASLLALLPAFFSAFLAFFSAFRAALSAAFSAFFAAFFSAFDRLAMLAPIHICIEEGLAALQAIFFPGVGSRPSREMPAPISC